MKNLITVVSLLAFATTAEAETRYIVDQAKFTMRTGQSTDHKIVRLLSSGTAVELLEQSADGYSRIRTSSGKEGWILSRYLMSSPAARDRLAQLEKDLNQLLAIKKEKQEIEAENIELKDKVGQLAAELALLQKTAANATEIVAANTSLKAEAAEAKRALEELRSEIESLSNGAYQRWFMLGGGAILIGILLGLLLPRMRPRKKRRWGGY